MKTILSFGDIIDSYYQIRLKGVQALAGRFGWSEKSRVTKAWDRNESFPAQWWSVPEIRNRWNFLITGDADKDYRQYIVDKYLAGKENLKLLSPGCGDGSKELKFAEYSNFDSIEAFDLAPGNIAKARENAERSGFTHLRYFVQDAAEFDFGQSRYDCIVFDSFLHHIKDLEAVADKIHGGLQPDGILVINEYVGPNRFQWRDDQLRLANKILRELPTEYRKRWRSDRVKSGIYRPGLLRMVVSDPSEAVDSEHILGALRKRFTVLEEKPYGGNLLHLALKDIAHNFIGDSPEKNRILHKLFDIEDEFLKDHESDFVFGVYGK